MVNIWLAVLLFFVGMFVPFIFAVIVASKKSTKDRKKIMQDFIDTHILHDPSFEEYCQLINTLRNGDKNE